MIDRNQVMCVYDVEKSSVHAGWYDVEFIQKRGEMYLKIKYPYKTRAAADAMKLFLDKKSEKEILPDARADVYFLNEFVRGR